MVIRNMLYDAMNYYAQVNEYIREHKNNKDLQREEYISGFSKEDKLMPVITITVYWNSGEWDGSRTLHEMLDVKNKELLEYVPDYKMNLIVPEDIEAFDKFETELGNVLNFIKCSDDKDKFESDFLAQKNIVLSDDAIDVLNVCVNAKLNNPKEGGETDMCKAIDEIREDAKNIGREEGREEGEERLAKLIKILSEEKRDKELQKALIDKNVRERLYKEYSFV